MSNEEGTSGAPGAAADVATLHQPHPKVRAQDWRSPLISKVSPSKLYKDGTTRMSTSYRDESMAEKVCDLHLYWSGLREDFEQCVKTYQASVLTEFATLGLACILLTENTDLRITEVTRRGERADYWIGDTTVRRRLLLEVGGKSSGNIDALAQEKTDQLLDNPWARSGFICVAVYDGPDARLWFCPAGSVT